MVSNAEHHAVVQSAFESMAGNGTEESPYQITDVYELQSIHLSKSSTFKLICNIDASVTNEWNDGKGFAPIGKSKHQNGKPFTGDFYGDGFEITNLNINRPLENNVGLFGMIDKDGIIRDLEVRNSNINGDFAVGCVIGYNKQGNTTQITLNNVSIDGNCLVGGFVGWNYELSSITNIEGNEIYVIGSGSIGCISGENNGFIAGFDINNKCTLGEKNIGEVCGLNRGKLKQTYK